MIHKRKRTSTTLKKKEKVTNVYSVVAVFNDCYSSYSYFETKMKRKHFK